MAVKDDASGRGALEVEDRPAQSGLAATGFAHEAEDFALADLETDSVDSLHVADLVTQQAAHYREVLDHAPNLEQLRSVGVACGLGDRCGCDVR